MFPRPFPLLPLLGVLFAAVLVACLLTPLVFSGLVHAFPHFGYPYSRVFDRVFLVLAACGLVVLARRMRGVVLPRLWLPGEQRQFWSVAVLAACVSLGVGLLCLPLLVDGVRLGWESPSWSRILAKTPLMILTAVVVAPLEEVFFRGLILPALRVRWPAFLAVVLTSMLYAVVHFVTPDKGWTLPTEGWLPGFVYLEAVVERALLPGVVSGMVGLFLVGVVLGTVTVRSGSLALAIGAHAGWIFLMKLSLLLTFEVPGAVFPPGVGRRYFLVSSPVGWGAVVMVLPLLLALGQMLSKPRREQLSETSGVT